MTATKPLTRHSGQRTRSAHCYASGTTHPDVWTRTIPAAVLAACQRVACPSCGQFVPVEFAPGTNWRIARHQYRAPVDPEAVRLVLGPAIVADCRVSIRPGPGMHAALWRAVAEARVYQAAEDDPSAWMPMSGGLTRRRRPTVGWCASSTRCSATRS